MGLFNFSWLKKKKDEEAAQPASAVLGEKLARTRSRIKDGLGKLFSQSRKIDEDLLEEIESELLMADVGVDVTQKVMKEIEQSVTKAQLNDTSALREALEKSLEKIIKPAAQPLQIDTSKKPYTILVVGVNGSGKTTTIGKLCKQLTGAGQSVILAAGDTFRAAAVEQLQTWGERNSVPVISQGNGADSAAVIFDAMSAAKARGADVLIADTAGRLHTQNGLMEELKKVKRVIQKVDETAPHEVMIVLDGTSGQNALNQAKMFNEAMGLTGITITKLDGTAKGGIVFAIAESLNIPLRFIGVGESVDDLRVFESKEFVDALLGDQKVE